MEGRLPSTIQEMARQLFEIFKKDPFDPLLHNEDLYDSKKGRHRKGSRKVEITRRYRAIYVIDNGPDGRSEEQICWYWVGSREDYANFIYAR